MSSFKFQALPVSNLTNSRLSISSEQLLKEHHKLDELLQDMVAILFFGSACTNDVTAKILDRCNIGGYLGQLEKLKRLVKQRYIWLSNITWEM